MPPDAPFPLSEMRITGADPRVAFPERRPRSARRQLVFLASAALAALLLGSEPLLEWTRKLPASPAADVLVASAENWHGLMQGLRLTAPYSAVRRLTRSAEAAT